jgi:hypothetical protein
MVYAPDRDWADLVITEMSMFPVGRYDVGLAETDEEEQQVKIGTVMHRPRPKRLYHC